MERSGNCLRSIWLTAILFISLITSAWSQDALDAISFTWVDVDNGANDYKAVSSASAGQTIDPNVNYTIFFSRNTTTNNNRKVSGYTINGTSYSFLLDPDTLALRRIGTATRLSLWIEAEQAVNNTLNQIYLAPERQVPERSLYQANLLNIGYDNVLVNSGTNASNIERIDAIYGSGMLTSTPANAIIPVMDRGANGEFKIAMITSLDANGEPDGYGNLVTVNQGDFGSGVVSFSLSILFLQQSLGEDPIPTGSSTQNLGGVGVSFSDLGISANQIVYGYSLFSVDVDDLIHDLTDISTFPTNSSNSGLDMAAGAVSAASSDGNLVAATGPGGYKSALSTWLKANAIADITTSTEGSTVTDWQDHWLGNHDATTGVAAPTYRSTTSSINFNPTIDFTSGSTSLSIANNTDFNTAASYTNKGINLAFRTSSSDISTRQVLYEQGGNTRGISIYIRSGNLHVSTWNRNNDGTGSPWNNATNITSISTAIATNTEYIISLELAGSSSTNGSLTAYLNGASFGTLSGVGLLYNDTDGIEFGGSDGSTQYDDGTNSATNSFLGEIPEFIYCNEPGSFTTAQRNQIESYLAIKYGITLDQSSPVNYVNANGDIIFNTSINASIGGYLEYNNDIAGIGRDDDSELDQPASKSENSDAIVTIDRGATISTNDTWLIWGNDNGALTETNLLTMPTEVDSRLTRVWRVAEENEVLTTSVSFDLTGLGLSTSQSDFSLLIAGNSTNADFSSATVVSGGVLVSNTLTFSGVDLEDGQYFTLGTKFFECSPGGAETNLTLWLKADDGTNTTTDGVEVTSWTDQTGSNNASATGGTAPTYAESNINFNPALDFDGSTEFIDGAAGFHTAGYYFVLKPDITYSTAFAGVVPLGFDTSSSGATNDLGGFYIGNAYSVGDVVGQIIGNQSTEYARREVNASKKFAAGIPVLFGVRNNSGGTETNIYQDGLQIDNSSVGSFLSVSDEEYELGRFEIPNAFNLSNFYNGKIAELISYSTRPGDNEHSRIQSYLAIKYGVSLDQSTATDYENSTGSTIWNAATNVSYNADIAGIGRDDRSCLNQKQSKSQNEGSIVTMGLGTVASSNTANTNTFDDDGDFLIWGNDGDFANQTNANTSDLPGNVTERMERIWKVEDTGNVGATSVQFDLTGLGYTTNLSDFQLIVSNSATMASGTLTPATSINGNIITFSNIDLTDGQFFTLATNRTSCGPGGVETNMVLWLKADSEAFNTGTTQATDGQTVATWSDQSVAVNNAVTDGNPPAFRSNTTDNINFLPTLDFDGTNDRLSLGDLSEVKSATGTGRYSLFGVGLRDDTFSEYVIGSEGGNTNEDLLFGYRTSVAASISHWSNDLFLTVTAYNSPSLQPFLLSATYDGTGRTLEESRDNSFARATDSNTTDVSGTRTNYIGDVNTTGNYNGKISEVLAYNSAISDIEKLRVYTYFGIKYGLTLPQDNDNDATVNETISGSVAEGDYVASDGTTIIWDESDGYATYHHGIAGIGRDDASCLNQKQSKSETDGAILTVGLGSVAGDNTSNVNNHDDLDFLVWGHDDASTLESQTNTADVPATIAERMSRVWRVEDTGNVGSTELQFDLTGLGYTINANNFALVTSNSATMANGTLTTGGTFNGNVLSFSGVDLTDGQYFTLTTQYEACGPGGVNTDIALWLRADTDVFSDAGATSANDGDNVLQWNDQGSAGNNASEDNAGGGSPVEPTLQTNEMNFNPIIRFSNAQSTNNSWLETASNTTSGAMSLISVFKTGQNDGSATDFTESPALVSGEAANNNDYALGLGEGRLFINAADNTAYNARSTSTYVDNIARIGTATRAQSTAAGSINLYVNSGNVATGVSTNSTLNSASTFALGNHSVYDVDGQYEGDIAETIVFNKVLSETERTRVESYLAIKYGITREVTGLSESAEDYLAADGGIIWDIDNQGVTYHNDIFGIGRDDLSCFEQIKSKSENSDALVTIDNTTSFGTNDSFLISGNDNANIENENNSEKPAGIKSRLNREWRVQETGTVGSVQLTYDLSTITGPLGVGTNNFNLLRLLVDNDGDFTNGVTFISPSSVDGSANTATFTVDFTSGQYYTLGSTESAALPVTLIAFTAINDNNEQVIINWTSVEETGNAFYSIERSHDASHFQKIGSIPGAGNSQSVLEYTFTDKSPVSGHSYYRLRQTDFNGKSTTTEVSHVFIESAASSEFRIYPNPVNSGETLKVSYHSNREEKVVVQFISSQGKLIKTSEYLLFQGSHYFTSGTTGFSPGVYLIKISPINGKTSTLRVIVN
ncbi:MAG: T9SS type A sorting domain-containing protein [Roseivirga sp.]|nr:T9SS type A sorting domain-containing protein [Roseivirga sp.]